MPKIDSSNFSIENEIKNLKTKLGQLQEQISKASFPVSGNLPRESLSFMRLILRSSKNIYNLLSIMLHITPWILVLMLQIRQSIYLLLTNALSASISDAPHYIRWNKHNTVCIYNSGKGRCTWYEWSNDMFVLWNQISAILYEDRKYCLHIFLKQHALVR